MLWNFFFSFLFFFMMRSDLEKKIYTCPDKGLTTKSKAADAGYTSRDDAEYAKDMCAEVSGLIAAGLLSKGVARAQAKPIATLSPDVVEKLKALCPVGATLGLNGGRRPGGRRPWRRGRA